MIPKRKAKRKGEPDENDLSKKKSESTAVKHFTGKKRNTSGLKKFSKGYQPSKMNKREGGRRMWLLRDLINQVPGKFYDEEGNDLVPIAAKALGLYTDEVTIKVLMEFQQVAKAAIKGDTIAYKAIMDRAIGSPRQIPEEATSLPGEKAKHVLILGPGRVIEY